MNIDKSLDDIISTKKRSRGPRRQRGNPPASSKQQAGVAAPAPAAVPAAQAAAANVHVGDKIIVSNLSALVSSPRRPFELFTTTVGPVRTVSLSYNAQGKSKGIATVGFNKAEHATSAYQQYNKRLIDGSRRLLLFSNELHRAGSTIGQPSS
ncbi:SPOSA6832_04040 [Sporobolomyces salmonicolor]|uniref:SPOSA6832_04040-mRNA-1:cds n=1 Tax=Sporidiobolus salmonicolor TaxID=5005 RepID=A0A0D6ER46_SPOSA|nr:SPOSA6832_04040 [Sporobolomyces salmonicolor]